MSAPQVDDAAVAPPDHMHTPCARCRWVEAAYPVLVAENERLERENALLHQILDEARTFASYSFDQILDSLAVTGAEPRADEAEK